MDGLLPCVWGRAYVHWEHCKHGKDPVTGHRKQPDLFQSPRRPEMCFTTTQSSTVIGASHRVPEVRRQSPGHLKGHGGNQEVKPLGHRQVPLASPKSHLTPQTRPASHNPVCSLLLCKQRDGL